MSFYGMFDRLGYHIVEYRLAESLWFEVLCFLIRGIIRIKSGMIWLRARSWSFVNFWHFGVWLIQIYFNSIDILVSYCSMVCQRRSCTSHIQRLWSSSLLLAIQLILLSAQHTCSYRLDYGDFNFQWRTLIGNRRFLNTLLCYLEYHLLRHLLYHPIPLWYQILLDRTLRIHFIRQHHSLLDNELIYQLLKNQFVFFLQSFFCSAGSGIAGAHACVVVFVVGGVCFAQIYGCVLDASIDDARRFKDVHY